MRKPKLVTVASHKGGVGKSTTALHLAAYLSQHGKTLLLDVDENESCARWRTRRLSNIESGILANKYGDMPFCILSHKDPDIADIGTKIEEHDFIVVDTKARPDNIGVDTINHSHVIILPTKADIVSFEPVVDTYKDLGQKTRLRSRALITMASHVTRKKDGIFATDAQHMKNYLSRNGFPLFSTTIRNTLTLADVAEVGLLANESDNTYCKKLWKDYQAVGDEVLRMMIP